MNLYKYSTSWRYRYFHKKLYGVKRMIEDQIFKRFKTLEIKEDVRRTYEDTMSRLVSAQEALKAEEKTPTLKEDEKKRLEDQIVLLERDADRYKGQIQSLEMEVYGAKQSNEYPDGVPGINHQLDALQELQQMIKVYMEEL